MGSPREKKKQRQPAYTKLLRWVIDRNCHHDNFSRKHEGTASLAQCYGIEGCLQRGRGCRRVRHVDRHASLTTDILNDKTA